MGLIYAIECKKSEIYYVECKKIEFTFSFSILSYIYIYIWLSEIFIYFLFFFFPFSHFILFCAFLKILLSGPSPSAVTNITNTHCHSQHSLSQHSLSITTLTDTHNTHSHSQHSPLVLFYKHPFNFIICTKSEHFHYFPNSHHTIQFTVKNFSACDRKHSWHINVKDHC